MGSFAFIDERGNVGRKFTCGSGRTRSVHMPPCEMPTDFDSVIWDNLGVLFGRYPNKPAWNGLVNAHNGIAYRFHAAAAADDRFSATFSFAGQRCLEEGALFSFFFNAISCVDCALYGLHHLGALMMSLGFPIANDGDLRAINRKTVRARFEKAFPGESLTVLVGNILDDPVFAQLLEFRDFLAHRGAIPRNHRVVMQEPNIARIPHDVDAAFVTAKPKSLRDQGLMELNDKTTSRFRAWLAVAVRSLLAETLRFSEARLPPVGAS